MASHLDEKTPYLYEDNYTSAYKSCNGFAWISVCKWGEWFIPGVGASMLQPLVDRVGREPCGSRPNRVAPSITARYFSSCPSDSTSRWTPCPPGAYNAPGQRGITPAFGYGAPHPSARGTLTLLIWVLPSAHYEVIRLPAPNLPSSLFGCPAYSHVRKKCRVSQVAAQTQCLTCHGHRPRGSKHLLAISVDVCVDFHFLNSVVLPIFPFRGSIPSTLRLTACLLAVLRIKPDVTIRSSRTCYPVVGHLPGRDSHPLVCTTLPGRNSE